MKIVISGEVDKFWLEKEPAVIGDVADIFFTFSGNRLDIRRKNRQGDVVKQTIEIREERAIIHISE